MVIVFVTSFYIVPVFTNLAGLHRSCQNAVGQCGTPQPHGSIKQALNRGFQKSLGPAGGEPGSYPIG
jgi:hypothetical protein